MSVYKEHHLKKEKVADVLRASPDGRKVLIVFWHGVGDTLMFLPVFDYLREQFPQHAFTLGLLPGVDQDVFLAKHWPVVAVPEAEFLNGHDMAFVVSFPMNEGSGVETKAEYCCRVELGLPARTFGLPDLAGPKPNKLVGMHLQGTCLPGSTNPDEATAKRLWDDVAAAGFVPFDLHFCHTFHNPANAVFPWATRSCRDLPPSLTTLQMMIERCVAVMAVASGPFVLAASIMPRRTIYLQKHHHISCYMRGFINVLNLPVYMGEFDVGRKMLERERLVAMLRAIEAGN